VVSGETRRAAKIEKAFQDVWQTTYGFLWMACMFAGFVSRETPFAR